MRADLHTRCIAVVGMNGAGKTVFGKRLGAKLGWKRVDTDKEFEKLHGDQHAYIEKHGWETFRREEERIVLEALAPGQVAILSGGAIESPAVRAALKEKAIVLWLQANAKRITRHLKKAKVTRPEFKKGVRHEAVENILATRTPHYASVADIVIPASIPFARQVPVAIMRLHGEKPDPRR